MKIISSLAIVLLFLGSCAEQAENPNKVTYYLHQANYTQVSGTVVFEELAPGKVKVVIEVKNTSEAIMHPAHLHFGSISEVGDLAYELTPVDGKTGKSVTIMDQVELSDGQIFSYQSLEEMNGSVKIHMNDTFFSHMVLSFGNVGKNENYFFDGVTVCTGH